MRRSARQGKRRLLKTSWFRFIVRSRKTTMIPMLPISPGIHPPVTSLRFFMSLRFCMSAFHAAGGLEDRDGDGDAAPARDSLAPHAPAPTAEAIVKEAPRLHSRAKRGRSWNARSPPPVRIPSIGFPPHAADLLYYPRHGFSTSNNRRRRRTRRRGSGPRLRPHGRSYAPCDRIGRCDCQDALQPLDRRTREEPSRI